MNKKELLSDLAYEHFLYPDTITKDERNKERTIRKCADPKKKAKRKAKQTSQRKNRGR